ncbi:unnamed protein product [Pleuronectes platessa]|uniref:Uncharacterized protein n=1 Tax=Pleuronectes platessa TaxID=8262 RepID=A0A9N7ZAS6_PLEPL|nr:unnamed protein product [Pleuronectes platessa]
MEHELLRLPGVYQLDVNGSIQVLLPSTHTTNSPYGSNKHQEPTCAPVHDKTHLISSTLSATSMHIDEGKRSHHESRLQAVVGKQKVPVERPMCKQAAGEMPSSSTPVTRLWCVRLLSLTSCVTINRIPRVSALPPSQRAHLPVFSSFTSSSRAEMRTSRSIHTRRQSVESCAVDAPRMN